MELYARVAKSPPPCLFYKGVLKNMSRGEIVWRMKGPVLALTWIDKKPVFAAGTYTGAPPRELPEINRKQRSGSIQKVTCPPIISALIQHIHGWCR